MAIDLSKHKAVVLVDAEKAFGFPHIYSAASFVERQAGKNAFDTIAEAFDEGTEIDGVKFQIFDAATYVDLFETVEEDESDDDE